MVRALDALEGRIEELSGAVTIGTLAVATVLGYLDLRFAEDQWRVGRPRLAAWFVEAGRRPSFEVTRPPAP
jgi:glutathione S-transferase